MSLFTVHCNFTAQEDVELSVRKGEIVTAIDEDTHDGWVQVEVVGDKERVGFVPLSHLTPSAAQVGGDSRLQSSAVGATSLGNCSFLVDESPKVCNSAKQSKLDCSYMLNKDNSHSMIGNNYDSVGTVGGSSYVNAMELDVVANTHVRSLSDTDQATRRAQISGKTLGTNLQSATDPSTNSLLYDTGAVVESFMKNELHLKQLARRRQDELAKMRSALEEAKNDVGVCREKKEKLAVKLRDLDLSMDRMRKRWKNMLEQEKDHILRSMTSSGIDH